MQIKRQLTPEQKQILANRDKPSEADQLQAMKDFIEYAALKLLQLEERHANLSPLQS